MTKPMTSMFCNLFHAPHTTNTILIIMLRKGWQKIIKRMNAVQRQMHVREPQILGPHSSVPNTNGFLWIEMVVVDTAGVTDVSSCSDWAFIFTSERTMRI